MQDYLTSDQIFENLIPVCFHHMTESVLPVRSAAAVTLAKLIRYRFSQTCKIYCTRVLVKILESLVMSWPNILLLVGNLYVVETQKILLQGNEQKVTVSAQFPIFTF